MGNRVSPVEKSHDTLFRTHRFNCLFDFYGKLLTEKQQRCVTLYIQENYTLAEIGELYGISRQAVYEHLRRAGVQFEEYEQKLCLYANHLHRQQTVEKLQEAWQSGAPYERVHAYIQSLRDDFLMQEDDFLTQENEEAQGGHGSGI